MNFPKISMLQLKICALHAHFNFELIKGVAALIFKPHSWNFGKGSSIYDIRWHGGRGGSAKSDFISKGSLIKHLMRGEGGQKRLKII